MRRIYQLSCSPQHNVTIATSIITSLYALLQLEFSIISLKHNSINFVSVILLFIPKKKTIQSLNQRKNLKYLAAY